MASREAVTIRFPVELLTQAREVKTARESLNDLVIEAVEHEVRRRQGLHVYADIVRIREIVESQTGPQPDSGPILRSLREGLGRRG